MAADLSMCYSNYQFMPKGIGNPTNPKQTGTQGLTNNGVNSDSGPASIAMRAEADEEYTHLLAYKEVRQIFI